jgi:SAM-dependent methyltransferase
LVPALDCPACGCATVHRLLYRKKNCDILRCEECGLGRTDASGFDPASYYTGDYFEGGHADGYADYLGAEPVLRREFRETVGLIRLLKPAGRLLELGSAYGFFLAEAAAHYEVTGIEIAADAAAFGRGRGLRIISGVADEKTLAGLGTFDVIVMLDVIEHLPNPRDTLALCERHLNSGGIIVISTGDFGSLPAKLLGARWRLMTPPQHLWFFTRTSMLRLGNSLGLQMERFEHPWKTVPLSLIAFQLARMAGLHGRAKSSTSSIGVPVNLFDAMRVVLRKPAS